MPPRQSPSHHPQHSNGYSESGAELKNSGLDMLREQLYARGSGDPDLGHTDLTLHAKNETPTLPVWKPESIPPLEQVITPTESLVGMSTRIKRRNRIRMILLGGGAIFFVIAAVLASAYIFFGKNAISGDNITLEARGPFAVGGGEKFDFTISLKNQNAVPIEAATLNIDYPQGTQSGSEQGKTLFRERKVINRIGPGEIMNIPASAIVFGEENEEKQIKVAIDYRVQGSNATFFREAQPLKFKISSSPVTMSVDAIGSVTSGQEVSFGVTLTSNSPTPLEGLLLKAEYPSSFSFSSSEPRPVAGEDTWRIANLKPKEKKTITIKGVLSGKNAEKKTFKLLAGVPNDKDPYQLSSVFTTKLHEVGLEAAFVNLDMSVNGKPGETIVLSGGSAAQVEITFRNTLSETIYDAVIAAEVEGNALDERTISAGSGFYDSAKNTITWDSVGTRELKEIAPGASQTVTFSLTPRSSEEGIPTPQVKATVSVKGKRISSNSVPQSLTSAVSRTMKVETETSLTSQTFHSTGPFKNSGPLPPVAEKATTYTIIMALTNTSNPLSDAVVEATLPPYVTWSNETQAAVGTVSYNASTRVVTWKAGDVEVNKTVGAAYKVTIQPSLTQVGTVPTLVLEQRSRAKDRFTGNTIRSVASDVSTLLADETDETKQEGRVRQTE